jgi:hypothetical protein
MTDEELAEIFGRAEAVPAIRGQTPTYNYFVPNGGGVVDAGQWSAIRPHIENLTFIGYTTDAPRSPVFGLPLDAGTA